MIQMLREIFGMFRQQKIYLFLLLAIVLFYLIFYLVHKKANTEEPVNPQKQRIEMILKEAPQNSREIERRLADRPVLRAIVQLFTLFFMSAFLYGVWLGTLDLKKWFQKQELIPRAWNSFAISWGISEIVKVLILFLSLGIILNLIVVFLKSLLSISIDTSTYMLFHTVILDGSAVVMILFFIQKSGAQIMDVLGIRPIRLSEELWWGIRTYFLILPIFICILIGLVLLANALSYEPPPHPLVEILLEDEKTPFWIVFSSFLLACVVGPVVEEVFFRGFFYPAVRKYVGAGWTMLITAILFAGVHENIFSFTPIFFLGLALCYLYEKRSNLVSCITLHVVHNTAFIVYFFIMKSILFGA